MAWDHKCTSWRLPRENRSGIPHNMRIYFANAVFGAFLLTVRITYTSFI